jgi:hypothetical protein
MRRMGDTFYKRARLNSSYFEMGNWRFHEKLEVAGEDPSQR